jgi:TonB family protein
VTVDERGMPAHCAITKSSGFPALDVAVCKAAMNVHYLPRLINGKATVGVYRDAFTFRELSEDENNPFERP